MGELHINVGDGLISLFRICAHLVSTTDDLVLYIDEPELSLSPINQKSLANLLSKKSTNKQIIINTHSPHMIRWQDIQSGAQVYRTIKTAAGNCEIRKLNTNQAAVTRILAAMDAICLRDGSFFSARMLSGET